MNAKCAICNTDILLGKWICHDCQVKFGDKIDQAIANLKKFITSQEIITLNSQQFIHVCEKDSELGKGVHGIKCQTKGIVFRWIFPMVSAQEMYFINRIIECLNACAGEQPVMEIVQFYKDQVILHQNRVHARDKTIDFLNARIKELEKELSEENESVLLGISYV